MSEHVPLETILSTRQRVGSDENIPFGPITHTSRIGMGSYELLTNFLTEIFVAETKNSATTIINRPKLSSMNDDRTDFHRSEMVRRGARLGCRSGEVSSGMSAPFGGDSSSDDDDACRATGV